MKNITFKAVSLFLVLFLFISCKVDEDGNIVPDPILTKGQMILDYEGKKLVSTNAIASNIVLSSGMVTSFTGTFLDGLITKTLTIILSDDTGNPERTYDVATGDEATVLFGFGGEEFATHWNNNLHGSGSIQATILDTTAREVKGMGTAIVAGKDNTSSTKDLQFEFFLSF